MAAAASQRISITFDIDSSYNSIDLSYNNKVYTLSGDKTADMVSINNFFSNILQPTNIMSLYASLTNSLSNRNTLNNNTRFRSKNFKFIKSALENADPTFITAFNSLSTKKMLDWAITNNSTASRSRYIASQLTSGTVSSEPTANKINTIIQSGVIKNYSDSSGNFTDESPTVDVLTAIRADITKAGAPTTSAEFMPTLFTQSFLDRFKSSLDTWFGQIQKDQNIDPTKLMIKPWKGGESNNKTAKIYK